jgi:hypothetical protein
MVPTQAGVCLEVSVTVRSLLGLLPELILGSQNVHIHQDDYFNLNEPAVQPGFLHCCNVRTTIY